MTRLVLTAFVAAGLLATPAVRADPLPVAPDDAPFAAAMAAYRDRATLDRHREAQQAFARLARERPADYDAQVWCARTSFYVAHRLVQADDTRDDFNGDLQLFGVLVAVRIQFREV